MIEKSLARGLLDVARRIRVGKTLFRDDELVNEAAHALAAALAALDAQPAAECKAGGACRWRGNASAQFLAAHDAAALPQEPMTDEQIDVMWRRAGIANNARGAFFAGARATLAQQQEPVAHIVVIKTDAGPTKFFTAPSDQRGFPVYTHPPQDAKDAARYRDDLISCRGMVKTELNHYERLALVHGKTAVAENYEKEAQRLSDLLDRIDAAIKETPC